MATKIKIARVPEDKECLKRAKAAREKATKK
jgi:hypothetical protein